MPLPPLDDFAELVLPDDVPRNDVDEHLFKRLTVLADKVDIMYRQLEINWEPRKWLTPFATELGELARLLVPVLHPTVRDDMTWKILYGLALSVGVVPKASEDYLRGLFGRNASTPESIAAFFSTYFVWG